jgi:lysophospholipase L1-like esterase
MPDSLPSVYVIGDSISIQYGPSLERNLKGVAQYHRKEGLDEAILNLDEPLGANGGDSGRVLRYLKACSEKEKLQRFDLFCLNCGLHDIKIKKDTQQIQTSQDDYRKNLLDVVDIAQQLTDQLIWMTTTCVDDDKHVQRTNFEYSRYQKDIDAYNAIAVEVMNEKNVKVIDLAAFTLRCGEDLHYDGVHYNPEIIEKQAAFLAGYLSALLPDSTLALKD